MFQAECFIDHIRKNKSKFIFHSLAASASRRIGDQNNTCAE